MLKTALIAAGMLITAGTAAYATTGTTPVKPHRGQQIVIPGGPWTTTNYTIVTTPYVDTSPCASVDIYLTWTGAQPNLNVEAYQNGQDYGTIYLGGANSAANGAGTWRLNNDTIGPQTAIQVFAQNTTVTSASLYCRPYS